MAARGRKPLPTALKVPEGDRGKGRRPISKDEPTPSQENVKCPSWLMPEAKKEPETFDRVQKMIEQRSRVRHFSGATIFSTKIHCGECGGWFGSKVWHSTDQYRRVIWRCNAKYSGRLFGGAFFVFIFKRILYLL